MIDYDIIVLGGGHAGIEAAMVGAKSGMKTALVTMDKSKIGLMSCNPAIGGLAKGQLVRELDALGGTMGRITDEAGIHFKMLNTSKGPAVQSPRAQTDRQLYAQTAQKYLYEASGIHIIEDMGIGLELDENKVFKLSLLSQNKVRAKAIILTAGTFLGGEIFIGLDRLKAGRAGELPVSGLTKSLESLGLISKRLKTGTPPRIHKDSIDFTKVEIQEPDPVPQPFSFQTEQIDQKQINCYITYTNGNTHAVLRQGFERSPLFSGMIKGVGPRYCPSIEDKIFRFQDKDRHQIFLEPEGYSSNEIYVNGFSTSLPADIQERAIRTIPGLKKAAITRLGYAVEYDYFPANQLKLTLESKKLNNLFLAGQVCGTSGYEEAAVQGYIAGLNAVLNLKGKPPFILRRSEAYIGVLIDDLINKDQDEPYRMFTSRAEFRLMLRHDNADLRLMPYGRHFGLIDDQVYEKFLHRKYEIEKLYREEIKKRIPAADFNEIYSDKSTPLNQDQPLENLIKRPELRLTELLRLVSNASYSEKSINEVEFKLKYQGYIQRQMRQIERFKNLESKKLPENIEYSTIKSLSTESREKLMKIRPENLGQASRIPGVSPADLSVLLVHLHKDKEPGVSRET